MYNTERNTAHLPSIPTAESHRTHVLNVQRCSVKRRNSHLEHLECRLQPLPPGRFAKKLS